MVGRKESFWVLMGMKGTGTSFTVSLGGLCACVLYKLPYLYQNELGHFTSCNMSTRPCPSRSRPDLYDHCGYCATCKWYSVVVWDWKVPHPHASGHLPQVAALVGKLWNLRTHGGHVTGSVKTSTASGSSLNSLLPVYCDVHKQPPPAPLLCPTCCVSLAPCEARIQQILSQVGCRSSSQ